ncbi:MAG: glycosyltransferase [Pseudomonadota bacterium]|jgi:hypothetical protein
MDNSCPIITGVLSLHREGELLRDSFRSLLAALRRLDIEGIAWEMLCILDRSDDHTRQVVAEEMDKNEIVGERLKVHEVNRGDLGLSRNEAARLAQGHFVGFLDGDDLCSAEWLLRAYRCCERDRRLIAHPAANIYFGRSKGIFVHPDQVRYDIRSLFFHNLWTALSFAARDVYCSLPYEANELDSGLGYEDWNFNCRSIAAGYKHVAVPQTCHFIRVKAEKEGLCEQSAAQLCVIKRVPLWSRLAEESEVLSTDISDSELAGLVANDPQRINIRQLPQWLRDEVSRQAPSIGSDDSLANISPPTLNKLASFLPQPVLKRIGAGVRELHFIASASLGCRSTADKLVVCDDALNWPDTEEPLVLAQLERHLHERLVLFVGALITQTNCSRIHLWDSIKAPALIARLQQLIRRCNVTVVWHQMIPGDFPAQVSSQEMDVLPEAWRLQSEVNSSAKTLSYGIDAPREKDQLRVLFLIDCPRDRNPWASQSIWYRVIGPGQALQARGHEVMFGLLGEEDFWRVIIERYRCDIVVTHRPGRSRHFQELRRITRQRGVPLVYEVDDNIISPSEIRHAEHLKLRTARELESIVAWANENVQCLSECDAAIFATPELQACAQGKQLHSWVAPNFIPDFYKPPSVLPDIAARKSGQFTLFYGPGSLEHGVYFEAIGAQLAEALKAIPDSKLVLGGGLSAPTTLASMANRVERIPRVAPQLYMQCLSKVDVVLAPIVLDPFSKCKSWIKALEATAMGSQWIGSALPDYERFTHKTATGAVVKNEAGWVEAIKEMHSRVVSGHRGDIPEGFGAWMSDHVDEYADLLRTIRNNHGSSARVMPQTKFAASDLEQEPVHCQVYWACAAGGFSEERSLRCKVVTGQLLTYSFNVEAPGISKLRIDPIDVAGTTEVVELVVRGTGGKKVIFRADERGGWGRLVIAGAQAGQSSLGQLLLDGDGIDPQIYLPTMRDPVNSLSVSITMRPGRQDQSVSSTRHGRRGWTEWFRTRRMAAG